jgi:Vitamin K-dependent gamma-carboxylase
VNALVKQSRSGMNAVVTTWRGFWFEPEPTSTLALVRIAFGLVSFGWMLGLLPVLFPLIGHRGVLPSQADLGQGTWGLLGLAGGDGAVLALFVITLAASACLALGYRTRLSALLVFVGLLSFQRRDLWAFDAGDDLVRIVAAYLALSAAGSSLSLDRLRRARDRFWEFPSRSRWPVRLMQVQLSLVYLASVWAKTRGTAWNDGTAVSYALRIKDYNRFPVPSGITTSVLISNLATYGTLALELAIGILVWNRKARPWVLGAGVALHLAIAYSIRVGFFTLTMFVLYLAFLPNESAARLIEWARYRLRAPAATRTKSRTFAKLSMWSTARTIERI